jgi:hypothetical protein
MIELKMQQGTKMYQATEKNCVSCSYKPNVDGIELTKSYLYVHRQSGTIMVSARVPENLHSKIDSVVQVDAHTRYAFDAEAEEIL